MSTPTHYCLLAALFWLVAGEGVGAAASRDAANHREAHWAYRPLAAPALPVIEDAELEEWSRNPVDRFVVRALSDRGLRPSRSADKRVLLRRVYFDLTGLPPIPEEVDAFVADEGTDAFDRVVDRLLASPRYGERWARHWMDLVHFAESHGHDQDRPRENAWPYRDYLIRAFNGDTPYARFVEEQVAGDILYPRDPWAVVATGFLAAGPWDESSLRDIREDSIDRQIGRYLDRDDVVMTTMSTFASTTVQCARCHDHKFDPVSQEEYYNLQAVFAGVDKADRRYDPDPLVAERRRELEGRLAGLDQRLQRLDPELLDGALQTELRQWEKKVSASQWRVLTPDTVTSSNGATLQVQADGSVLSSGTRPETDVYTIVGRPDLGTITGVRLEVMLDESLPHRGPGRQDNGNLHLNEFLMRVGEPDAGAGDIQFVSARADFDQAGWTAAMAIDGQAGTAWGIYPQVGSAHQVVFLPGRPVVMNGGGGRLAFELKQTHGGGHLIGRARLSVTDSADPMEIEPVPPEIRRLLAVAEADRSDRDRGEIAVYYLRRRYEAELAALPEMALVYTGNNRFAPDGSFKPSDTPRTVHVLGRGDIHKPGKTAAPGTLACVAGLSAVFDLKDEADEGARRVALARWLADDRNGLVWRSIVNRVWQYHFGAGLVDTPNDFGVMGGTPSHPELLDWLAMWLQREGGSLKALHRLILTSATYRQASTYHSPYADRDADNRYLWRMNRVRMDAETVRDTWMQVAGTLDLRMGGPSAKQFNQKPGVHVTPEVDYLAFDVDAAANYRRSVYRFVFRTVADPLMEALDFPDSSMLAPRRSESLSPLQALALVNNGFLVRQSERMAERLSGMAPDLKGQLQVLYRLALSRVPTQTEADAVVAYASRHGMANACRYVLNSNEFIFID